jgi:putative colanic acid biosynthesis UDP-glucose lipid carrier transferase
MTKGKQHIQLDSSVAVNVGELYFGPVSKNKLRKPFFAFIKRSVDLILGGILTLILLPFIPIIALIIIIDSRGPVFFVQKRTGVDKKTFYCIKFRSMVVNKEADRLQVQPGDSRITTSGYYLRKFYIDEIPQLINVLWGDMSLVGPRPHMLRHNVTYAQLIPHYHERHSIKPGITGLAQLRGYHGMIRTPEDLKNRVSSDIEYIENWTLPGDIGIFFGTLKHVIKSLGWEKD